MIIAIGMVHSTVYVLHGLWNMAFTTAIDNPARVNTRINSTVIDAIKPDLPYATMNISGAPRNIGSPSEQYKSEDIFTYPIKKVLTFTVNIYAGREDGYLEKIDNIINSLQLPTIQETLRNAGFSIWTHSDPLDLSEILDTQTEFRAGVDIDLSYNEDVDDTVGEIRYVGIDGDLNP